MQLFLHYTWGIHKNNCPMLYLSGNPNFSVASMKKASVVFAKLFVAAPRYMIYKKVGKGWKLLSQYKLTTFPNVISHDFKPIH